MKSIVEVFGKVNSNYKNLATNVALQVLKFTNQPEGLEIAISFVTENEIQKINNDFRGINKVTDVLSFPSTELSVGETLKIDDYLVFKNEVGLIHFGDMAICTKQMERQAKEYGVAAEVELKKLVIHSMLHFMGYDHIEDDDYLVMNKLEQELDEKIKI